MTRFPWGITETLKIILSFLGLSYEEEIFHKYFENVSKKIPDSSKKYHTNIFRPIDKRLVYSWKYNLSMLDQALSYQIAGELLKEVGYPIQVVRIPEWRLKIQIMYHAIKRAIKWRVETLKTNFKN